MFAELTHLKKREYYLNQALEAAEAKVAELEASALGGYEDGWHTLRTERDALKAKLEAVLGLKD